MNLVVTKAGIAATAIVPFKPGFLSSPSRPTNLPSASKPCNFRASTTAILNLLLHQDLTVLFRLRAFEFTFHHNVSLLRLSHRFFVGRYSTWARSLRMASARGRCLFKGEYFTRQIFNPATLRAVASALRGCNFRLIAIRTSRISAGKAYCEAAAQWSAVPSR